MADARYLLTGVEFEVLWADLTGKAPPPVLLLDSPGRTHGQRARIRAAAGQALRDRGLADATGPDAGLVRLLRALAQPSEQLELRAYWGARVRAVAATRDRAAETGATVGGTGAWGGAGDGAGGTGAGWRGAGDGAGGTGPGWRGAGDGAGGTGPGWRGAGDGAGGTGPGWRGAGDGAGGTGPGWRGAGDGAGGTGPGWRGAGDGAGGTGPGWRGAGDGAGGTGPGWRGAGDGAGGTGPGWRGAGDGAGGTGPGWNGSGALAVRTGDTVLVTGCSSLPLALLSALPPGRPGPGWVVSVPTSVLAATLAAPALLPALLAGQIRRSDARLLDRMLSGVERRAQVVALVASAPDGVLRRRGGVISVLEGPSGRYLVTRATGPDGTDWTTVAPAHPRRLRQRVAELLPCPPAHVR